MYIYAPLYVYIEKEMATHSSILAWKSPWTGEPGWLQSMGLQSWAWLSDLTTKEKRIKVSLVSLYNHNSEVMVPDIFPGSHPLVPVNTDSPKFLPPLKILLRHSAVPLASVLDLLLWVSALGSARPSLRSPMSLLGNMQVYEVPSTSQTWERDSRTLLRVLSWPS